MDEKNAGDLPANIFTMDTDKMAVNGHQTRVDSDKISTGPLVARVAETLSQRKVVSSHTCEGINTFLDTTRVAAYITVERTLVRLRSIKPHTLYSDFVIVEGEIHPGETIETVLYIGKFSMVISFD